MKKHLGKHFPDVSSNAKWAAAILSVDECPLPEYGITLNLVLCESRNVAEIDRSIYEAAIGCH